MELGIYSCVGTRFLGPVSPRVQAADAQLDASIAGYDDVLVTLLADVANNYVTIRVRQEQFAC